MTSLNSSQLAMLAVSHSRCTLSGLHGVTMAPFMITESPLISRPLPVNNIISPPPLEDLQGDSRVVCLYVLPWMEGVSRRVRGEGGGMGLRLIEVRAVVTK